MPAARAQTAAAQTAAADKAPTQFPAPKLLVRVASVNLFVGTAEHGQTYPGAPPPFGITQISLDTPTQGWDGASGCYYADKVIRGFSFTHFSGASRASESGDWRRTVNQRVPGVADALDKINDKTINFFANYQDEHGRSDCGASQRFQHEHQRRAQESGCRSENPRSVNQSLKTQNPPFAEEFSASQRPQI